MQKLSDTKIKIIHRNGQNVSGIPAPKKGLTFFGFFNSPKAETRGKNAVAVLKEPASKNSQPSVPRANLTAVKNWVALEEKIVHDYKEQRETLLKSATPSPKTPAKQPPPAFETFSTQTAVSSSPRTSKLKDPLRDTGTTFLKLGKVLLVLGGLAVGVFVLLNIQKSFSGQEVSQRFVQLQSEKEKLSRSYADLEAASEDQSAEIKWLNGQVRDMASEIKKAKAEKAAFEQALEKKYREELMRITVRYESELAVLRDQVQTQSAIVNALKAQGQAFEKIIDQAGMSALSGAAAGLPSVFQGEVTSVNARQGFVVINLGAAQGARSGRWITISRSGIGIAIGRIDRVYPTMSVALLQSRGMLQVVQEGDNVFFS
jgi:biopolymer transport protein ExbB/TolQ